MKIDKEIFNLIKRTKKRLNKLIRTKYFLFGTLGGLFVGAIINGVAIFVSMYYSLWFSLGAVFLGMILGEIVARFNYYKNEEAALNLDISAGLKERITTAYELRNKKDVFSVLQKEDAYRYGVGIDIKKTFPLKVKKPIFLGICILLIGFIVLANIPSIAKDRAKEEYLVQKEAKDEIQKIEDTKEEISKVDELSKEEQAALQEQLDLADRKSVV